MGKGKLIDALRFGPGDEGRRWLGSSDDVSGRDGRRDRPTGREEVPWGGSKLRVLPVD